MKKKTTRKIRRNKRATTQRRKNRSYKRMKGGAKWKWFQDKKKIVKLLTNLIINKYPEPTIIKFCQQQSLPTAGQPLLLKNTTQVKQELIDIYKSIINPIYTGKFEYSFSNDDITNSIIKALNTENISYFDDLVKKESTVAILSPDEFERSLTSIDKIWTIIPDALVYSMFALALKIIKVAPLVYSDVTAKIDLTDKVC